MVVIVTGAGSGIGKQIAVTLSAEGHDVVLTCRHTERIREFDDKLSGNYSIIKSDVISEKSVRHLFAQVMRRYGRVDALVNNAGYVDPRGLLDTTLKNWRITLDTNLTGTFLCTREAVRFMKTSGGAVINIASTSGLSPRPGWSAYAAAKAGVIHLSSTLAEELMVYGIRVYTICPGRTATPLRKILAPDEDPKTIMQPQRVAEIVSFCLSERGAPIEGQPIIVRERF